MITRVFIISTAFLLVSGNVAAHDFKSKDIRVEHPWAEPTAAPAQTASVYLLVSNDGKESDTLLKVATTAGLAASASLRAAAIDGDGMKNAVLREGVAVPGNGRALLKPGGRHISLNDLRVPLTMGMRFPVFLTFERAGTVEVEVWVEESAAEHGPHDAKGHH